MTNVSPSNLDALYEVLSFPVTDINLIYHLVAVEHKVVRISAEPVTRTFFVMSFGPSATQAIVFFLGLTNDNIDVHLAGDLDDELIAVSGLIKADDPEIESICLVSMSQLINPVFNSGAATVSGITTIIADDEQRQRIIGIVFAFDFSIRLGLHIFDDYRMSICFNDNCDIIVSQARRQRRISVIERTLCSSSTPKLSEIEWFDWL